MSYLFFKRIIDIFAAVIVFFILLPILVLVIIILAINNQGNPFFFQNRPGKNERIFKLVKLKTMRDTKDPSGVLLPDEQRLTKIGGFIRKTSIDELPQLINVIKGDMSIVGPRPLLVEYVSLYNTTQKLRHNVRPGITGWAQVNGRNAISWEQKFEYDVWYVKNFSFLLDMKILWLTVKGVIMSKNVSAAGHVTISKFEGSTS